MAKFFGKIGIASAKEVRPGVFAPDYAEKTYFGDVTTNQRKWEEGEGVNDDFNVGNVISIVADEYSFKHASLIRYVEWMGAKWKVKSIDIVPPRLILRLGGLWNGETPSASGTT